MYARALWNNMLSPLGSKATSWSKDPPFLCPSPQSPFLATRYWQPSKETLGLYFVVAQIYSRIGKGSGCFSNTVVIICLINSLRGLASIPINLSLTALN